MHNQTIENEDTSKKKITPIIQKIKYLYNMRVPFNTRYGLKMIYGFHEIDPGVFKILCQLDIIRI